MRLSTSFPPTPAALRRHGWLVVLIGLPVALGACPGRVLGQNSVAQARARQATLDAITKTFYQRLETTLSYQEPALPPGRRRVERYLQLGTGHYLLEYQVADSLQQRRLRESYWLEIVGRDTLRTSKAKYQLSNGTRWNDRTLVALAYTDNPHDFAVEASQVTLLGEFDPVAVVGLRPGAARDGQTVYALSYRFDEQQQLLADTLACYRLSRSRTGDTCRVALQQRRLPAPHPWAGNNHPGPSWLVELSRRRVTATHIFSSGEGYFEYVWVRTSGPDGSFVETLTSSWPSPIHAAGPESMRHYERELRWRSATEAVETYSVSENLRFTVVSKYR